MSSTSVDSSNSTAAWKHKYKALEAEHTNAYTQKTKRWGFGRWKSLLVLVIIYIFSVAEIQMSAGRVLKWTIDMFHEPWEMIEENDRWYELLELEEMVLSAE